MKKIVWLFLISQMLVAADSQCPREEIDKLEKQIVAAENQAKIEDALALVEKILKVCPKEYRSMNTKAGLLGKIGKFEEELVWADKAITINKNFWQAHVNRGNALAPLGRLEEAKSAFTTANKIDPKAAPPVYSLGVYEENKNNFKEALALYEKAVKLDPNFLEAQYNQAAMLANLQKAKEAKAVLTKLIERKPSNWEQQSLISDAKKLLDVIESRESKK